MECLLSLKGMNKSFGGIRVLNNVDFNLRKGTVHALVGGNGAGKSTLMKIMTGVYTCDSGTITLNGEEKKVNSPRDMIDSGVRMIFQEMSLIPTLTVTENIFLNHEIKIGAHLNKREMAKQAKALLEDLEIYDIDVNSKVEELSVGVCQIVEIAKALSFDPSVLVMDEPTASLTDREIDVLFKIIARLKAKGTAIVYISHRMKEIFQIADEISVLRDGFLVASTPANEMDMPTLVDHIIGSSTKKSMEWKDREHPVSDEVMLEVENLSLDGRLHDVSFKLRKGEVLGLAGLMGSGRTEVLEFLAGINRAPEATLKLEGNKLKFKNPQQAIDSGIVLVPEDRRRQGLVLMHSFKDNLILPNLKRVKRGLSISKSKSTQVSREAIGKFNIKVNDVFAEIFRISGGNQQKVVIAKWLKTDPKVLLMDEPTAGVDIGAKGEIIDIIRKFTADGKSVILVSSELAELISVSDRVLVLNNGRITNELTHDEITSEEMLQLEIQR